MVVIKRWKVVWIMAWTNTFMRWNGVYIKYDVEKEHNMKTLQ